MLQVFALVSYNFVGSTRTRPLAVIVQKPHELTHTRQSHYNKYSLVYGVSIVLVFAVGFSVAPRAIK